MGHLQSTRNDFSADSWGQIFGHRQLPSLWNLWNRNRCRVWLMNHRVKGCGFVEERMREQVPQLNQYRSVSWTDVGHWANFLFQITVFHHEKTEFSNKTAYIADLNNNCQTFTVTNHHQGQRKTYQIPCHKKGVSMTPKSSSSQKLFIILARASASVWIQPSLRVNIRFRREEMLKRSILQRKFLIFTSFLSNS